MEGVRWVVVLSYREGTPAPFKGISFARGGVSVIRAPIGCSATTEPVASALSIGRASHLGVLLFRQKYVISSQGFFQILESSACPVSRNCRPLGSSSRPTSTGPGCRFFLAAIFLRTSTRTRGLVRVLFGWKSGNGAPGVVLGEVVNGSVLTSEDCRGPAARRQRLQCRAHDMSYSLYLWRRDCTRSGRLGLDEL